MQIVWVVGQVHVDERNQQIDGWEMQGVFTSEELALAACANWRYFIGPMKLDEPAPALKATWPGAWYPHAPEARDGP